MQFLQKLGFFSCLFFHQHEPTRNLAGHRIHFDPYVKCVLKKI